MIIVQYFFDSGSIGGRPVKGLLGELPSKASKRSSALGRGYWSTLRDWLTLALKSLQRRTLPFGLGTGSHLFAMCDLFQDSLTLQMV